MHVMPDDMIRIYDADACAIPGCGGTYRLSLDHDRSCCPGAESCGKCIRGLICLHCNVGMGHFQDDPDRMRAAIAYLESGFRHETEPWVARYRTKRTTQ